MDAVTVAVSTATPATPRKPSPSPPQHTAGGAAAATALPPLPLPVIAATDDDNDDDNDDEGTRSAEKSGRKREERREKREGRREKSAMRWPGYCTSVTSTPCHDAHTHNTRPGHTLTLTLTCATTLLRCGINADGPHAHGGIK
jgi:hypothetical protein